jgi:tRNA threonylcarbamoyl adenosine modification protein (Sua5/YciO/YrdC/YwlC family)
VKVVSLDADYPETWLVGPAVEALRRGELVIIPTDSIYALACDPWNHSAVAALYAAKRMEKTKRCSVMCGSLKEIGQVARAVSNEAFRFMRSHLPGAYTVLLHASRDLPRQATGGRKSIGVRIPDDPIALAVLESFGGPILVSSVPNWESDGAIDPVETVKQLARQPSVILDQGKKAAEPSSVVDFTGREPELIRLGKGEVDLESA